MIVVRVQDFRNRARQILLLDGFVVFALVEAGKLEVIDGFRIPDAERIDDAVLVSEHRNIIRHGADGRIIFVNVFVLSRLRIEFNPCVPAEADFLGMLRTLQFKRIDILQPVVRHFDLIAVPDLLLEHSVMIADAAAVGFVSESRQRIQEAGSQSSEAAVAQCRIRLLIFQRIDIAVQVFQCFPDAVILAQVEQVVSQKASDQEFH